MRTILTITLTLFAVSAFPQDMPACPEDEAVQVAEGGSAFQGFCRACHSIGQILDWVARQSDGEGALIAAYLAFLPIDQ